MTKKSKNSIISVIGGIEMKLGIGADHRAYLQKQNVIKFLEKKGYTVIDYGTSNNTSVDYPDFAFKVANDVKNKQIDIGILMCANGIGMSIAANKVKGIRCAKVSNIKEAKHSRYDNDCNMIAVGSEQSLNKINKMILTFITTDFSQEERFIRRIGKIDNYDN